MAKDAADIKPKFVPTEALLPRDDSGGWNYQPRTAVWGDGGKPIGAKGYLSASGGDSGDSGMGSEVSRRERNRTQ
jgi:hypothetical protein